MLLTMNCLTNSCVKVYLLVRHIRCLSFPARANQPNLTSAREEEAFPAPLPLLCGHGGTSLQRGAPLHIACPSPPPRPAPRAARPSLPCLAVPRRPGRCGLYTNTTFCHGTALSRSAVSSFRAWRARACVSVRASVTLSVCVASCDTCDRTRGHTGDHTCDQP